MRKGNNARRRRQLSPLDTFGVQPAKRICYVSAPPDPVSRLRRRIAAGGGDIHCRAFQDMDREEDRIARKGGEVGQAVAVSR